jgi:hypothetical protein
LHRLARDVGQRREFDDRRRLARRRAVRRVEFERAASVTWIEEDGTRCAPSRGVQRARNLNVSEGG